MDVVVDTAAVRKVFKALPAASLARLNQEIESSAIDVQRALRTAAPVGYSGQLRRQVRYTTNPAQLSAEIFPDVPYADDVEHGTRPHFVSAAPGSSLERWARHKGLNVYAVRSSIARKGTKAHPFVQPVFDRARVTVPRDIAAGFGRFIGEVNNGRV